ncbi:MAG: KGG domain-containing protein [Pseudomonadota bacterium]
MATQTSDNQGKQGGTSGRGFGSMDPQRQRDISSEGGRASHESGKAHEFTSEEAREAGKKSHGGHPGSDNKNKPGGSSSQGGSGG